MNVWPCNPLEDTWNLRGCTWICQNKCRMPQNHWLYLSNSAWTKCHGANVRYPTFFKVIFNGLITSWTSYVYCKRVTRCQVLIQDPEKWGSAGLPHVRCAIAGECLAAIDPLLGRDVCMMDIAEFQDCLQQGATDAAWHNFWSVSSLTFNVIGGRRSSEDVGNDWHIYIYWTHHLEQKKYQVGQVTTCSHSNNIPVRYACVPSLTTATASWCHHHPAPLAVAQPGAYQRMLRGRACYEGYVIYVMKDMLKVQSHTHTNAYVICIYICVCVLYINVIYTYRLHTHTPVLIHTDINMFVLYM